MSPIKVCFFQVSGLKPQVTILEISHLTSHISHLFFLLLNHMLTATNHTLEKLETLLRTAGYRVRYEKGNFKTGACLLQSNKVIVINKFSGLESKIQSIAELTRTLDIDINLLDEKQFAFLQQLRQTTIEF